MRLADSAICGRRIARSDFMARSVLPNARQVSTES